ncbi:hypothetical protein ACJ41O_012901 [Fusarium nematophilum]
MSAPGDGVVETRLNRTCEGCRRRKIKCILDSPECDTVSKRCVRCTKLDLDCLFSPPAIKRRRKRNETRIRELEQKLEEVRQSVANDQRTHLGTPSNSDLVLVSGRPVGPLFTCTDPPSMNGLEAKIPSLEAPGLWQSLFKDTERYVMERALIEGHKSLDLIQAAMVLATWSHPPDKFQDLNFGQFVNIAATMVIDLRSSNDKRYQISSGGDDALQVDRLETARTFSACYLLCSSIAMSFRRPSVLRYGSWVKDCIDILDPPSIAHIGDRRLAAWIRLQRLAEESLAMVGLDEGSSINYSDPRTHLILKGGVERVKEWRRTLPEDIMNETLDMHYHIILLNLCEPGLHDTHEVQDFRPPYAIHTLPSNDALTRDSPQFLNVRIECIEIARHLTSQFLQFSVDALRQVPVIVYTRMMYAVVVMIKLEVFSRPSTDLSFASKGDQVSAIGMVRCILEKLASASDGSRFRVPTTFHAVLQRLLGRCGESYSRLHMGQDEIIEPLMNLQVDESSNDGFSPPQITLTQDDMMNHQVLQTGTSGHDVGSFAEPMMQFNGFFQSAPDDAAAMIFWNSFLGDAFLSTSSEQGYDPSMNQ